MEGSHGDYRGDGNEIMIGAKILADSVCNGHRLTTFECTFPRVILAEFNTHRMISRNAASSRAIPVEKMIQRVIDDPFIPDFRLNQKGMQAGELLDEFGAEQAVRDWLSARDKMVAVATNMHGLNIHKQYINRLLEPWMWATVIASATDWANFFHLRCDPAAEPSFQKLALIMRDQYESHEPRRLTRNEAHLPLVGDIDEGWLISEVCQISVGRCARVSYLTHDGKRDPVADIELCKRLAESGHWSPFEHAARAMDDDAYYGNFQGWKQFRKELDNENVEQKPYAD